MGGLFLFKLKGSDLFSLWVQPVNTTHYYSEKEKECCIMSRKPRILYNETDKALIWDRWQIAFRPMDS